ncbi:MAG: hypothetical protein J5J06_12985 [Phycisphaerae bacterium]|nr:hypothetical protein [Phycisphaerae bacterium]
MNGKRHGVVERRAAIDRVMSLLRRQDDLFERLEALSLRQRNLVSEDDTTPLLDVLVQRKRVVGELSAVHESLAAVRRVWSRFREGLEGEQRGEADRLVASSAARLSRVLEQDERDTHVLSVRRRVTATALSAARATGEAISVYRSATGATAAGRLDEAQ